MKQEILFTKMSGAGNDFVVVNNLDGTLLADAAQFSVVVCSRHFGVGADGVLLIEPSSRADFYMKYYNADGSYGGMCGNGGRCAARYAFLSGIAGKRMSFEALEHIYTAEIVDESVRLHMKQPRNLRNNVQSNTADGIFRGYFVDTGAPHTVIEVPDLERVDVEGLGRSIRLDSQFAPDGCNVNFVKQTGHRELAIRTYERGVEKETLACGTGSVAAAVVFSSAHGLKSPISVHVRSGEELRVYFDILDNQWSDIVLEGSALILFSGKLLYDADGNRIVDAMNQLTNFPVHP